MGNWIAPEETIPSSMMDAFTKAVAVQQFQNPGMFPNLRGKNLVMATDYSGDIKDSPFQILSFVLADAESVFKIFNPKRLEIRATYLPDGRRLSFKDLGDERKQKAIVPFLMAADSLNGIVLCAAIDKRVELSIDNFPDDEIKHKPAVWQKLLKIAMFGAVLIAGLSDATQEVHWVMDDDDIIANDELRKNAFQMIAWHLIQFCPDRGKISDESESDKITAGLKLGIASMFDDNGLAEDLVSIADFAAGSQAESLAMLGPDKIPRATSVVVPQLKPLSTKANLIGVWLGNNQVKLKKLVVVGRPDERGVMLLSVGQPAVHLDQPPNMAPMWLPMAKGWKNSSRFWNLKP